LSEAYIRASDHLYAVADPKGQRAVNTRVQLGLLIDSEASRAAEAARLATGAPASALTKIAQTLALVGDELWDDRLGARHTGFPAALLTT
jgi:hypothetical protein